MNGSPGQFQPPARTTVFSPSDPGCHTLERFPKTTLHTLSSPQQKYLLKLYLKLGCVSQASLESVLERHLGLVLPNCIANASDKVTGLRQKEAFKGRTSIKGSGGVLYSNRLYTRAQSNYKIWNEAHPSSRLLLPQEWLHLVWCCWMEQGFPPSSASSVTSTDDSLSDSEPNRGESKPCSTLPVSPRFGSISAFNERCAFHQVGSDATAVTKISNDEKQSCPDRGLHTRSWSPFTQRKDNVASAASCVSLSGMRDVIATLFRKCGGVLLKKTNKKDTSMFDTHGCFVLTLASWKKAIGRYAEECPRPPPEPILMDATNAIATLAALQVHGFTQLSQAGTLCNKRTHHSEQCIISFEAFTQFLRAELCGMQRDGVIRLSYEGIACRKAPFSTEPPNSFAHYCPLHTMRRPPTLCMLLACFDPINFSRIASTQGTAYLRSIGLMKSALCFFIHEVHMQLKELGQPISSTQTTKYSKASHPCSERGRKSTSLPTSSRDVNRGLNGVEHLGSYPLQCLRAPVPCSESHTPQRCVGSSVGEARVCSPTNRTRHWNNSVPARSKYKASAEHQKRYLTPRPMDEVTDSIVARAHARRVLETLRKNSVPINRYGCYAMIGKCYDGAETTNECKKRAAAFSENLTINTTAEFERDLMDISGNLSDPDALLAVKYFQQTETKVGCASLRPETFQRTNRTMFRFGGLLDKKIPYKAHKLIFERLSRPECNVRMYSARSTVLPFARSDTINAANTTKPESGCDASCATAGPVSPSLAVRNKGRVNPFTPLASSGLTSLASLSRSHAQNSATRSRPLTSLTTESGRGDKNCMHDAHTPRRTGLPQVDLSYQAKIEHACGDTAYPLHTHNPDIQLASSSLSFIPNNCVIDTHTGRKDADFTNSLNQHLNPPQHETHTSTERLALPHRSYRECAKELDKQSLRRRDPTTLFATKKKTATKVPRWVAQKARGLTSDLRKTTKLKGYSLGLYSMSPYVSNTPPYRS